MTAMITRIAQVQTTTDYPGICVFVKISGDEGDGFFASPSRSNAGELCQRINGYNKVVAERDEMRKQLAKTADALTSPLWFSATELRLVADAMDILNYSQADGWTMRQRLDAFWKTGPLVKNAGSFAAYLHELPNGGVQ